MWYSSHKNRLKVWQLYNKVLGFRKHISTRRKSPSIWRAGFYKAATLESEHRGRQRPNALQTHIPGLFPPPGWGRPAPAPAAPAPSRPGLGRHLLPRRGSAAGSPGACPTRERAAPGMGSTRNGLHREWAAPGMGHCQSRHGHPRQAELGFEVSILHLGKLQLIRYRHSSVQKSQSDFSKLCFSGIKQNVHMCEHYSFLKNKAWSSWCIRGMKTQGQWTFPRDLAPASSSLVAQTNIHRYF